MFQRSSTALLFATAILLLTPDAHAGFKSGAAFHAMAAAAPHPIRIPSRVVVPQTHSKLAVAPNGKILHPFPKFARHHHHHHDRFFASGLPFTTDWAPFYGSYYDPADATGYVDPALPDDTSTGSVRGAFYRTGCRSEDVSVPGSNGPTRVTVTRCSVPILEPLPPK
jgi:hypothetical protein